MRISLFRYTVNSANCSDLLLVTVLCWKTWLCAGQAEEQLLSTTQVFSRHGCLTTLPSFSSWLVSPFPNCSFSSIGGVALNLNTLWTLKSTKRRMDWKLRARFSCRCHEHSLQNEVRILTESWMNGAKLDLVIVWSEKCEGEFQSLNARLSRIGNITYHDRVY